MSKVFTSIVIFSIISGVTFTVIFSTTSVMFSIVIFSIISVTFSISVIFSITVTFSTISGSSVMFSIISVTFSVGTSVIFSITSEFYRILWGPEYSLLNFLTKPILRDKEKNAVGAHIYLVTGLIFSYMLYLVNLVHILVFITGMLIACFSDALAALIGRRCGKKKVKCIGGDIKTVEGFLAGTGSAFLIGLYFIGPIYGLIAAVVFFLLDYFPTKIADNILNPIVVSIAISLFVYILGFPIGWS